MVFARTAAMSFNRYTDRFIDKKNPRTEKREIPSGKVTPVSALILTIVSSVLFIVTTWFINPLVFYLSPVALLIILGYSYTKRFTFLCHFILGLGLSLSPMGAYLSVTGYFDIIPVLFGCIVLFWTAGFDIIYSLEDEFFDKSNQIFSIPAKIGKRNALILSWILHFVPAVILIYIGVYCHYGILFWTGTTIFIALLFYQHLIVKTNDLSKVNLAFATTNGIASISFAFFYILDFYFYFTFS